MQVWARSNFGQIVENNTVVAVFTGLDTRTNDYAQCAVDATNKLIWWASCNISGEAFSGWNPTGSGDPATGMGGFDFSAMGGTGLFYAAASLENATIWTANFGASPFTIPPPPVFTAWGL